METNAHSGTGVRGGPRSGFWRRFVGAVIDGIFVGIVTGILKAWLGTGAGSGAGLVVSAAYFTAFVGAARGQTLGQMALGMRVIGLADGAPIGYGRAFLRWFISLFSAVVILIGYLWMLWDKEKQTWHDKAANAVVVPVAHYPLR